MVQLTVFKVHQNRWNILDLYMNTEKWSVYSFKILNAIQKEGKIWVIQTDGYFGVFP